MKTCERRDYCVKCDGSVEKKGYRLQKRRKLYCFSSMNSAAGYNKLQVLGGAHRTYENGLSRHKTSGVIAHLCSECILGNATRIECLLHQSTWFILLSCKAYMCAKTSFEPSGVDTIGVSLTSLDDLVPSVHLTLDPVSSVSPYC